MKPGKTLSRSLVMGCIALLTFACLSTASADDTEVFFGAPPAGTNTAPNVLFVLDTSGSMTWSDTGYTGSRLERLRDAMTYILDSSSNINVGLMRFNGYNSGGSVLYPITPIDSLVCDGGTCQDVSITSRVTENNDDMEQYEDNGELTPSGSILSLGNYGSRSQLVGLRFQNVVIPSGATIKSAHIDFTSRFDNYATSNLEIVGHDIADSPSIATSDYYLTNVDKTDTSVGWSPPPWNIGDFYSSPDVSDIVQEIADRPDWCGGNAMGFVISGQGERAAYAYNGGNASRAPVLRITYDSESVPEDSGCTRSTAVSYIKETKDDAYEKQNDTKIRHGKLSHKIPQTRSDNTRKVVTRLRFQDLKIPKGAQIESASLIFNVKQKRSNEVGIDIKIEAHDNAPLLVSNNAWIGSQTTSSSTVSWNITSAENWDAGIEVFTPNLASLLQDVVDRSGWESDNSVAFQLSADPSHSSAYREFVSFDDDPARAPKLQVVYKINLGPSNLSLAAVNTAREEMKQLIRELSATGGTPIVDAYLEATNYMLGGNVEFGKERGLGTQKHRYHRVSHPQSYTGGQLVRNSACTDANIESQECKSEIINGTPSYVSPLTSSCQTSHIVFLSDGAATSNISADKVKALTGKDTCTVDSGVTSCGVELAEWLHDTDHNVNVPRSQNISTYTVGFNINSDFLKTLSTAGGGYYRDAASAQDLIDVFQDIIGEVVAVDTTFVGPGSTVNQFNRLTHRNDVYFALFKPSAKPDWQGNLKRYQAVANDEGGIDIVDRTGNDVLDEDTGFFSDNAKSFWGTGVDGKSVELGGAADKLSLSGPGGTGVRKLHTAIGDIPDEGIVLSSADSYLLHENNIAIEESTLGITEGDSSARQARRTKLLQWARGVDLDDQNHNSQTNDILKRMGDPMHSQPVILNYESGADSKTTIFVATNQGVLHALEHEEGTELYSFMPEELIKNVGTLYDNEQRSSHPYGLDGDISIMHDDVNGDVMVNSDEDAYLFVGMRRGGNLFYAFDISERTNPKLIWKIEGGNGDFSKLGQTWSKAVPTKIMVNGDIKSVLIFGGGYDAQNNDPSIDTLAATRTSGGKQPPDSIGNAIFIVDALTGELIWSGQSDNNGSRKFSDMHYSFPANIRVLDVNADGLSDQMYVGDVGGQLWRFDITPYHTTGDLVDGGVIARINGNGIKKSRRFYHEPDVALISNDGDRFLSVSIGTGWRAHPLNTAVEDRFYMIRQNTVFSKPAGYGKNKGTAANPNYAPLTESDLVDITDDLKPTTNQYGWFMKFEGSGEKSLGRSLTVNNQLVFTSYEPAQAGEPCTPAIGQGFGYVVNVLNGAPTVNLQNDGTEDTGDDSSTLSDDEIYYKGALLTKDDRRQMLSHGGIPPEPNLLIVESPVTRTPDDTSGDSSTGTDSGGTGDNGSSTSTPVVETQLGIETRIHLQAMPVDSGNTTQRMYWQDKGRGNRTPTQIAPVASSDND